MICWWVALRFVGLVGVGAWCLCVGWLLILCGVISGYLVVIGCDSWWRRSGWLVGDMVCVCSSVLFVFWSEVCGVCVGLLCGGSLANLRCGLLLDVVVVPGLVGFVSRLVGFVVEFVFVAEV